MGEGSGGKGGGNWECGTPLSIPSYMTVMIIKLGKGHENLIIPFSCPNKLSVQVWIKSIQRFIR